MRRSDEVQVRTPLVITSIERLFFIRIDESGLRDESSCHEQYNLALQTSASESQLQAAEAQFDHGFKYSVLPVTC